MTRHDNDDHNDVKLQLFTIDGTNFNSEVSFEEETIYWENEYDRVCHETKWYNDVCISCYIKLLKHIHHDKLQTISIYHTLWDSSCKTKLDEGNLKRLISKNDANKEYYVFIVNRQNLHWVFCIFFIKLNKCIVFDGFCQKGSQVVKEKIKLSRLYLLALFKEFPNSHLKEELTNEVEWSQRYPKQGNDDDYSCGPFVCCGIESFIKNPSDAPIFVFDKNDSIKQRKKLRYIFRELLMVNPKKIDTILEEYDKQT